MYGIFFILFKSRIREVGCTIEQIDHLVRIRNFAKFLTRPNSIVAKNTTSEGVRGISIVILFCRESHRETRDVLPLLGTHSTDIGHHGRFLSPRVHHLRSISCKGGIPEDTIGKIGRNEFIWRSHRQQAYFSFVTVRIATMSITDKKCHGKRILILKSITWLNYLHFQLA